MQSNFPDKVYLEKLVKAQERKVKEKSSQLELLQMYSGARLNWLGDFFTDPNVAWTKKCLQIDDLTFTGTSLSWNKILLDKCKRSPRKFSEFLASDKSSRTIFKDAVFSAVPILVRKEGDKLKVLDGTHRLVGAIMQEKKEIEAFVAELKGQPKPACEPHVVYDLIRAYQRGQNKDKKGLISALKFLSGDYNNIEDLLQTRFNKDWIPDQEIQQIIEEVRQD